MITNKNRMCWIVGTIATFLTSLLILVAIQAIIWTPIMIEIASVTWNDNPTI
jgi:hypothetical protein